MQEPNLNFLKEQALGNSEMILRILNVTKEEFPKEKALYYNLLDKKDFEELSKCVHKFKHKIALFGLNESLPLATQYENDLLQGKLLLKDEFHLILEKLTTFINYI